MKSRALVLSGGGARGAYQAGVLLGLNRLIKNCQIRTNPISILVGISAGAINAAYLAAHADAPAAAAESLARLWRTVQSSQIFRTDIGSLSRIGAGLIANFFVRGALRPCALLDTTPLHHFIGRHIAFERIRQNLAAGALTAVAVAATDYDTNTNVTFFDGKRPIAPWKRQNRIGVYRSLSESHVLASAAIPLFFSPVAIEGRYFGDGSLRNVAPLSPAIHLGADQVLAIGVRHPTVRPELFQEVGRKPSMARVLSVVLNAVMMDGVEADIERLQRISRTVGLLPEDAREGVKLRQVECLYIRPSKDIAKIAIEESRHLPRLLRYLLGSLGSLQEAAELTSYLMFEPQFTQRLVALGLADAEANRDALIEFLHS